MQRRVDPEALRLRRLLSAGAGASLASAPTLPTGGLAATRMRVARLCLMVPAEPFRLRQPRAAAPAAAKGTTTAVRRPQTLAQPVAGRPQLTRQARVATGPMGAMPAAHRRRLTRLPWAVEQQQPIPSRWACQPSGELSAPGMHPPLRRAVLRTWACDQPMRRQS